MFGLFDGSNAETFFHFVCLGCLTVAMLKHSFILYVWVMLSPCFTDSYLCALQTVTCVVQFLCCTDTLSLCCTDSYLCVVQTVMSVLYRQLSLCCTDSYLCVLQTAAMLNEEELRTEVTMLERTLRVKLCMQKLLSRPRLSESMGECLLLFFFFHWEWRQLSFWITLLLFCVVYAHPCRQLLGFFYREVEIESLRYAMNLSMLCVTQQTRQKPVWFKRFFPSSASKLWNLSLIHI